MKFIFILSILLWSKFNASEAFLVKKLKLLNELKSKLSGDFGLYTHGGDSTDYKAYSTHYYGGNYDNYGLNNNRAIYAGNHDYHKRNLYHTFSPNYVDETYVLRQPKIKMIKFIVPTKDTDIVDGDYYEGYGNSNSWAPIATNSIGIVRAPSMAGTASTTTTILTKIPYGYRSLYKKIQPYYGKTYLTYYGAPDVQSSSLSSTFSAQGSIGLDLGTYKTAKAW